MAVLAAIGTQSVLSPIQDGNESVVLLATGEDRAVGEGGASDFDFFVEPAAVVADFDAPAPPAYAYRAADVSLGTQGVFRGAHLQRGPPRS